VIAWLLDKKGYGITLGTINCISVLTGALMAIPWLWIQSVTLTFWMLGRFFMYSSYFTVFGALFGYVWTPRSRLQCRPVDQRLSFQRGPDSLTQSLARYPQFQKLWAARRRR